ncbi:hypothetical protein AVEN_24245-1 [Araneus ventricosus]|uniref:RNase H type-1 domain-containing protein n=1 Tax=Araneus ventricosus TaxID=182803 RepID=A0A4Y2G5D1_ARAVE|nr:hypothetical protein AVEN_24245-1 [Araneus ventricosus]
MTADNSIISEVHAEKALNEIFNVWRGAVLHDNCVTHTSTLLKCWNDMVAQKRFIAYTIDGTGDRTYFFQKEWPHDKRCLKPAPHSYFFRMKRYWLMSEWNFRCSHSAILSVGISMDMEMRFICPKNVPLLLILRILTGKAPSIDNQTSIKSAVNPKSHNTIARKIFKLLHSHPHIRVSWIKAHAGYIGNEETDRLAKETAEKENFPEISLGLPKSFIKTFLRQKMLTTWQMAWDDGDTGRLIHNIIPKVT